MQDFYIIDSTLRDGEQSAGVNFSKKEKIEIAKMLDDTGIDIIEAGVPAMGEEEIEVISEIVKNTKRAKILTWNRIVTDDIVKSIVSGAKHIHISAPVSDIQIYKKLDKSREWVLKRTAECIEYASSAGCSVSVGAEDASRANMEFLIKFYNTARKHGATRIRFADTLGVMEPVGVYNAIKRIYEETGMDIDFHGHNDFGMATANALSAYKAGAKYLSCTVNGLGERAGNTALEEIVAALRFILGCETGIDMTRLPELSGAVEAASGKKVADSKPIVGKGVFSHESGIHVDGLLKDASNYEAFDPIEVGRKREIVLGKSSGTAGVINKMKDYGIVINNDQANEIMRLIRKNSADKKSANVNDLLAEFIKENEKVLKKYKE